MKKYIGFVLLTLSVQLTFCKDAIETAIKAVNPKQLEEIFSPNVILRASDKERYIKLAREIVNHLRDFKPEHGSALIEEILQKEKFYGLKHLVTLYGGLMQAGLGGVGLYVYLRNKVNKESSSRSLLEKFYFWPMLFSGTILFSMSILKLTKDIRRKVYIRACAVLKILEDVPVVKE